MDTRIPVDRQVMVGFIRFYVESDDTMLKRRNILHGNSGRTNFKIWSVLGNRKKGKINGRIRSNQENTFPLRTRQFLHNENVNTLHPINNDEDSEESFHRAISPILWWAQFFGLLPLSGISANLPSRLIFKKISFRTAYAIIVAASIFVMAILSIIHMIKTLKPESFGVRGGIAAATAGAIFYGNGLCGTIMFLWLSPRWVILQNDWKAMEQFIDSNKYQRPRLRWKFIIISSIILFFALFEHIVSVINNSTNFEWGTSNSTFTNFLHIYTVNSHNFILENVDYNFAIGLYVFIVSKIATFVWNFTDLFVVLISTGLAERYKTLNKRLFDTAKKHTNNVDWSEYRNDYAILSSLVKKVDNDISPIILLSFANNLYFICLQLLNGISGPEGDDILSNLYFFGSFAFLILRTCAVTLLTARINDQSKTVLPLLYNCSSSTYNIETQRLQYQLSTDDISLTGLRFFSITRNFMLALTGAIVTYEVVLLQFNVAMIN
ncbi:gustatory receptor for sugar taste 64f-like isoform X2 [Vespa velutina]|uniref:gustatory receptor for sugar taste 64f-like isoform X2 n=1 Tax=Vespa velutina TaxID=202808 RepID=UPI001FB395D4|nr:gustatory receptor for sugar taste 64f-like isoform X2 [Vespa velutina]